jgi:hypothetical protein
MDENQKTLEERLNEVVENLEMEETELPPTEEDTIGDTHAPEQVEEEPTPEQATEEEKEDIPEQPAEKTFTQSQVNDLIGNTRKEARDRALRELLEKYGVNNDSELDGVFGKGQAYDLLNDDYNNQYNELTAARTENALLKSKIRPERWEDAKAILGSKGLEVSVENILAETATHPEWLTEQTSATKQVGKEELEELTTQVSNNRNKAELEATLNEKPSTITRLGTSVDSEKEPVDEKKRAMSFFGL